MFDLKEKTHSCNEILTKYLFANDDFTVSVFTADWDGKGEKIQYPVTAMPKHPELLPRLVFGSAQSVFFHFPPALAEDQVQKVREWLMSVDGQLTEIRELFQKVEQEIT